ncbi:hypothetical protein LWC34_44160 [Kibdelosporangium philippinense]|uniref:Uncharacterized protein n=2 Tax=Kibdelosporangium philippinense TaxID=211113 RepID=A0ABS8ZQA8_9PSEU|nr:hypothetical protein [Kibdelosporangium philippinense]MCE7009759.1 hypothetical protein [Kibdelosporangium philippinense]
MAGTAVLVLAGLAAPASAAIPGLQRVEATSPTNSEEHRFVTATCPDDKLLVSMGGEVVGGHGAVAIGAVRPMGDSPTAIRSVRVQAAESTSTDFTGNWSVTAYAVCADPLPGLVVVEAKSPSTIQSHKHITATCPTGKQVVGAGAVAMVGAPYIQMVGLVPDGGPTAAPTSVTASLFGGIGAGFGWTASAFAVCADPIPGLSTIEHTSVTDSTTSKTVTPRCPSGKQLLGTGGAITGKLHTGSTRSRLGFVSLRPESTEANVGVHELGAIPNEWSVSGYAICATA